MYESFLIPILAPEGVDTPTLSVVSETAIRVSWMAPEKPNGDITGYNVFKNGERIETGLTLPGSYVLTNLQPYTVYEIQVGTPSVTKLLDTCVFSFVKTLLSTLQPHLSPHSSTKSGRKIIDLVLCVND